MIVLLLPCQDCSQEILMTSPSEHRVRMTIRKSDEPSGFLLGVGKCLDCDWTFTSKDLEDFRKKIREHRKGQET